MRNLFFSMDNKCEIVNVPIATLEITSCIQVTPYLVVCFHESHSGLHEHLLMARSELIAAPTSETCDFEVRENASDCLHILLSSL